MNTLAKGVRSNRVVGAGEWEKERLGQSSRLRVGRVAASLIVVLLSSHAQAQPGNPHPVDSFSGHPRVVIISDIGNEPDDQMSFVRLLLYSNELDLEAMIASTSTWQRTATHPENHACHRQGLQRGTTQPAVECQGLAPRLKSWDRRIFCRATSLRPGRNRNRQGFRRLGSTATSRGTRTTHAPCGSVFWGRGEHACPKP